MKIKESIKGILRMNGGDKGKNLGNYSRALHVLPYLILVFLVICMAAVLVKRSSQNNNEAEDSFEDCSVLAESCMNPDCSYYSFCAGNGRQACKIYNCGNDYGIHYVDGSGKIENRREAKPDYEAIEVEKEACKGTMEILEQNCTDNKLQAKVKIATKGECKIGKFYIFDENDEPQPNSFTRSEDGVYIITADGCRKITDIVPATEDGMALDV